MTYYYKNVVDFGFLHLFRYTLEFGLPIVESFLDKLSSWNQAVMTYFLEKVIIIRIGT